MFKDQFAIITVWAISCKFCHEYFVFCMVYEAVCVQPLWEQV